ncbi:MAG: DMT family transporter [Proteobacteria bacterium]|nr:DMT family transporter [Pseudomonadota bacterium]
MPSLPQIAPAPALAPSAIESERARRNRGTLLIVAAALLWSSGGLILRSVAVDSWTVIFWRSTASGLFLLMFLMIVERRRPLALFRAGGWPIVVTGVCFAVGSVSFVTALSLTTVANALMIQSLSPLIAGFMGLILMGERVRLQTWVAIAIALLGIAVMMGRLPQGEDLVGTLLSFLNAFAFAGATVNIRYNRTVRMIPAACIAAAIGAMVALPLATPLAPSFDALALLWFFGAGQLAVGMILFMTGARLLPAAQTSLLSLLEVILGPLWVWLVYGEDPGLFVLAGGLIVMVALAGHTVLDRAAWR